MLRVVFVVSNFRRNAGRWRSRPESTAGGPVAVYANGAAVGATTRALPQRIRTPWHCGHASSRQTDCIHSMAQFSGASKSDGSGHMFLTFDQRLNRPRARSGHRSGTVRTPECQTWRRGVTPPAFRNFAFTALVDRAFRIRKRRSLRCRRLAPRRSCVWRCRRRQTARSSRNAMGWSRATVDLPASTAPWISGVLSELRLR